jgi:DNA-binding transcriptional LysR family regulator
MIHVAQLTGGSVAVAILPSIATLWLPTLLRTFNARYPRVEVRVLAEDSASVQRLVATGEVDFGVSSLGQPDPRIDFQPLLQDRFGVLCRADHAFARAARPLAWEALRGQTILGNVMHRLLAESEVAELVTHPRIHVSNLPTLLALVEEGLGVTPIPALAFPPNRRALAFVPLVRPVKRRTIGTMSPAGRSLLPAAQALIDLLRAHIREDRKQQRAL